MTQGALTNGTESIGANNNPKGEKRREVLPFVGKRRDNKTFPGSLFDNKHYRRFVNYGITPDDYNNLCELLSLRSGTADSKEIEYDRTSRAADLEGKLIERDLVVEAYTMIKIDFNSQETSFQEIMKQAELIARDYRIGGFRIETKLTGMLENECLIFLTHRERNEVLERFKNISGVLSIKPEEDGLHIYNLSTQPK